MAYIYEIVNLVNSKLYVGKTTRTPSQRFRQHVSDSVKPQNRSRALYRAFAKYGVDNFKVMTLERCRVEVASEREMFWIDHLDTYRHGYNETFGGEGTLTLDYDEIAATFIECGSVSRTAELVGCSRASVARACHNLGIDTEKIGLDVHKRRNSKPVVMLADDGTERKFPSLSSAARYVRNAGLSEHPTKHLITNVCNGRGEVAYGHRWRWEATTYTNLV